MRSQTILFLFLSLVGCVAKTKSSNVLPEAEPFEKYAVGDPLATYEKTVTWTEIRAEREHLLQRYNERYAEEKDWFLNWQFGSGGGLPYVVLRLFPEVFPDIFGDWENKVGLPKNTTKPRSMLPLGLIDAPGPEIGVSYATATPIRVASFTCGSCHVGRVIDDLGREHLLVGAPNTTWDPFLFKAMIIEAIQDPRYTAANFRAALSRKGWGWLYGGQSWGLGQSAVFSTSVSTQLILDGIRDALLGAPGKPINDFLLQNTYAHDPKRMQGGNPGQAEIMSLVLNLVDAKRVESLPPDEKKEYLAQYLPPGPTIVDFMAVYRQSKVWTGQWDGNTPDPLLRNLGAEAASLGRASGLDMENAEKTTRYVADLPPPPYIFDVDMQKALEGERIYYQTCARCHAEGKFIPLTTIQTDKFRAIALSDASRQLLATGLKAACDLPSLPACQIPVDDIMIDRSRNPGYVAHRLDGIWTRAPYLHNGSVPTLYHILVPDERPDKFWRGNLQYDKEKVGFIWDRKANPYAKQYDTSWESNSNAGHGKEDPATFFGDYKFKENTAAREALLEYLKTL